MLKSPLEIIEEVLIGYGINRGGDYACEILYELERGGYVVSEAKVVQQRRTGN